MAVFAKGGYAVPLVSTGDKLDPLRRAVRPVPQGRQGGSVHGPGVAEREGPARRTSPASRSCSRARRRSRAARSRWTRPTSRSDVVATAGTHSGGGGAHAPRARAASQRGREPAIWFALPAILVYLVIVVYPSLAGAVYAFTDWSGIGGSAKWIGLENFKQLFTDDQSFGAAAQHGAADHLHRDRAERGRPRAGARRPRPHQEQVRAAGDLLRARRAQPGGDRLPVEVPLQPGSGQRHQRAARRSSASASCSRTGSATPASRSGRSASPSCGSTRATRWSSSSPASRASRGSWRRRRRSTAPGAGSGSATSCCRCSHPAVTINLMLSTIGGLKLFDQVFAITQRRPRLRDGDAVDADLQAGVRVRQLRLLDRRRAGAGDPRRRGLARPAAGPAQPRGGDDEPPLRPADLRAGAGHDLRRAALPVPRLRARHAVLQEHA